MRYVIYVKGDRGIQSLEGLKQAAIIPELCISEQSDPVIIDFCNQNSIKCIVENRPKSVEHVKLVTEFNFDLLVCAGYSKILPLSLFQAMPYGAVNCHGGRLPEYRGASPIPWQFINDEKYGVAYILKMTEGIDDGPILAQGRYEITEDDTARSVTDKVSNIFRKIVPEVVCLIAEGNYPEGTLQDEALACHWTRRYPEDGEIKWDKLTARQAVNLIRALDDPYPGAFIKINGNKIVIRKARQLNKKMAGVAGRCVGKTDAGTIVLATDGAVEILEYLDNSNVMAGNLLPVRYGEAL